MEGLESELGSSWLRRLMFEYVVEPHRTVLRGRDIWFRNGGCDRPNGLAWRPLAWLATGVSILELAIVPEHDC